MSSILADAWGDIFKLLSYSFYYVVVCVLYRRRHRVIHHRTPPVNGMGLVFFVVLFFPVEEIVKSTSIKTCCEGFSLTNGQEHLHNTPRNCLHFMPTDNQL